MYYFLLIPVKYILGEITKLFNREIIINEYKF